jgi:glycosyltransferase involved in cell wall biosynthesis
VSRRAPAVADPVVLHVLEALEGGTARHVVDMARHVEHYEHHVAIPSVRVGGLTDARAPQLLRDAGATVHVVEMRRAPLTMHNARALVQLHRLIRSIDAQVVHGHSSIGGALARLAARTTRRPCVYTPNGVATGRGPLAVERLLARATARIIAVSPSEAATLRSHHIAGGDLVEVIPNGIDADPPPVAPTVDLREVLDLPPTTPLVGTLARLVPQKAPERFVTLAGAVHRRAGDPHFVLIGDGPLRADIDRLMAASAARTHLHRIAELTGAETVLGQLDVFVLTSRFEGGPYAPLEAMRAGAPVVLTDVVGSHDVVEHGRTGFLAPQDDMEAMATIVAELLADPQRAQEVATAARASVRQRFDVVKTGRALAAVYGSLVAQPPHDL